MAGPLAHGHCSVCGRLVCLSSPNHNKWSKPINHKRTPSKRSSKRLVPPRPKLVCCEGSKIPVPPVDWSTLP